MFLFILTHLGADYDKLSKILEKHPRMKRCSFASYNSPADLIRMKDDMHQVFFDVLTMNHQFNSSLIKYCQFIYFVTGPGCKIDLPNSKDYYYFRLRRICEIAKKGKGILLTHEDSDLTKIKNFIQIKDGFDVADFSKHECEEEDAKKYEFYLDFLKLHSI